MNPTTDQTIERDINHGGTLVLRLAGVWQPVAALTVTPSILYQNEFRGVDRGAVLRQPAQLAHAHELPAQLGGSVSAWLQPQQADVTGGERLHLPSTHYWHYRDLSLSLRVSRSGPAGADPTAVPGCRRSRGNDDLVPYNARATEIAVETPK